MRVLILYENESGKCELTLLNLALVAKTIESSNCLDDHMILSDVLILTTDARSNF